jgi:hypothetical protein
MKRLSRTVTRRVKEFSKPAYLFKSGQQAIQRIHRFSAGHCAGRCTSLPGRIHLHNNQTRSAIAQSMIRKPMRNTHTISPFPKRRDGGEAGQKNVAGRTNRPDRSAHPRELDGPLLPGPPLSGTRHRARDSTARH